MPRIPDPLLKCVFHLYPSETAAGTGSPVGGTGFFVGLASAAVPDQRHTYAVSCRHVVLDQGSSVMRVNLNAGGTATIPTEPHEWVESADHDLAVIPVGFDFGIIRGAFLGAGMWLAREDLTRLDVGPGSDCFMVGRFLKQDGRTFNTPSVRFGNVSMLPVDMEHPRYPHRAEESFAVEMRSMVGYSGSPVFVLGGHADYANGTMRPPADIYLLGVNWGFLVEPLDVRERATPPAAIEQAYRDQPNIRYVLANTAMNGVVPAWRLLELLDHPKLKAHRDRQDAVWTELRNASSAPPSDVNT